MKRLIPVFVILFSFAACQKEVSLDTSGSTPVPGVSGAFTATIDGVPWVANRGAYASFTSAANGLPPLISIFGLGNDKKLVGVVTADSGVHAYTFTDNALSAGVFQDSSLANVNTFSSNAAPTQPSGTLTIRVIDTVTKTVSGTFSFTAYRPSDGQKRAITNGVFTNIPYTKDANLPPASSKDTFTVKIDGTPFVPFGISGMYVSLTNSLFVQGGNQAGTNNVALTFPADIKPGTYTLDFFGATYVGLYTTGSGALTSFSGTLTILEHNKTTKRVRGNFSFKGEDLLGIVSPAQLTEGYFAVTYQ